MSAPARFAARSLLGVGGVIASGIAFAIVLTVVASRWAPLRDADAAVVDALNAAVSTRPWAVSVLQLITDLGGSGSAWLVLTVAVVWLLVRRLPRLAVYVAVTGLGASVLNTGVKALVDRTRPMVDAPVASAPGASFPSGHAMGSTITDGVLLLVFLPAVPPRFRKPAVAGVVAAVAAVGVTRVAPAVHFPSDVLGGWLLGVLWLAVTAAAFRRWREEEGVRAKPVMEGLEPEDRLALVLAPTHESPVPAGWRGLAELLVAGVCIWGILLGLGLLITAGPGPIGRFDVAVSGWLNSIRAEDLTSIATVFNHLGSTDPILAVLIIASLLALAFTKRWAPSVFLLVAAAGETLLYLAVSTLVARPRPSFGPPTPELPPAASFPSGHVAATVVTYGGIALLLIAWTRSRLRYAALGLAVILVVGMALSRIYQGVHYPSDTLASVLYASAWLGACWWVFRPGRGALQGSEPATGAKSTA